MKIRGILFIGLILVMFAGIIALTGCESTGDESGCGSSCCGDMCGNKEKEETKATAAAKPVTTTTNATT